MNRRSFLGVALGAFVPVQSARAPLADAIVIERCWSIKHQPFRGIDREPVQRWADARPASLDAIFALFDEYKADFRRAYPGCL